MAARDPDPEGARADPEPQGRVEEQRLAVDAGRHRPVGFDLGRPVDGGEFLSILRLFLAGVDWGRPTHPPIRLEPGHLDLLLRGYEKAAPALAAWRASLRPRRRKVPA